MVRKWIIQILPTLLRNSSNTESSSYNNISTKTSTHTTSNQSIQIYQQPSIPTNSNLIGFQLNDYSHSNCSLSPSPSLNLLELNTSEYIMMCLTTNPKDEDITSHPKYRHHKRKRTTTRIDLYHQIKYPLNLQRNKKTI